MKVTVWNENLHEKMEERVTELYPGGLHAYIAGFLVDEGIQVRTATLDDEECGLSEEGLYLPLRVRVSGALTDRERARIAQIIWEDLGVPEPEQLYITEEDTP